MFFIHKQFMWEQECRIKETSVVNISNGCPQYISSVVNVSSCYYQKTLKALSEILFCCNWSFWVWSKIYFTSFSKFRIGGFVTIWIFWVLLQFHFKLFLLFEYLSFPCYWRFVIICVFEVCHNLSFWVLSQFEFWVLLHFKYFGFCHNLSFVLIFNFFFTFWQFFSSSVLSQLNFLELQLFLILTFFLLS